MLYLAEAAQRKGVVDEEYAGRALRHETGGYFRRTASCTQNSLQSV